MKNLLLTVLILFVLLPCRVFADSLIAEYAYNAPVNVSYNRYQLANYLTRPFNNDYDKLKVIAYWIASHIAYDGYKYNSGRVDVREIRYEYDVLKYRTGICTDFAELFTDMAKAVGISGVEYVNGYVLENQTTIKYKYRQQDVAGQTGHAWNRVKLGKRVFFVDTTFMAREQIGREKMRIAASIKHKTDLKKRSFQNKVNTQVNDFFFDFTPKQEIKKYGIIHLMNKHIH